MHQPPIAAQALIAMLVPAGRRDSVLGDLLEEYNDAKSPERGRSAADRWYIRQALGFLWHASAYAGYALAGNLTARLLLDTLVMSPPALASRAWITTLIAMGIFAAFGFRLGRVTGRVSGGLVLALAATAIGTALAYAATFLWLGAAMAVHATPQTLDVVREGLDIPAHVIALIGVILASGGALIGTLFTGSSGSRASIRT